MRLNLKDLKNVVDKTLAAKKTTGILREEITRVLGPTVIVNVGLERLAENANDRIDVLERTGRLETVKFKQAILLKLVESTIPEVRRLAARTLPEHFLSRFTNDVDDTVRHAAARRLPVSVISEMLRRTPRDDELRFILKKKIVSEGGVASPKQAPPLEMNREKLGDAVKQSPGPELSDQWYSTLAHKAISDYNHNIEGQWDEPWAHRYCASVKATSGVDIDEKKLWDEIQAQLKDRDDKILETFSFADLARNLMESITDEDAVVETNDPVRDLLESNLSSSEYVFEATKIFKIRETILPASLRKYRMSEGHKNEMKIPVTGRVPSQGGITSLVERALDTYVKRWNDVQFQTGEPIRINWSINPMGPGMFSFSAELK